MAPPVPVDVSDTLGAAYIGAIFTFILFGFTSLQAYIYFHLYPHDRALHKLLVLGIWLLCTTQVALVAGTMFQVLVADYSSGVAGLVKSTRTLYAALMLNVVISVLVQLFFVRRVFILASTKAEWTRIRYWITGLTGGLVLAHLVTGLFFVFKMIIADTLTHLYNLKHYMLTASILHVASELTIAITLCILLLQSRTSFRGTNDLLNTLMVFAINRSLLTSLCAVAGVVVFAVKKNSLWFMALELVICALHANSLLAALNTREALRARTELAHSNEGSGGQRRRSRWHTGGVIGSPATRYPPTRPNAMRSANSEHAVVHVTIEQETRSDLEMIDKKSPSTSDHDTEFVKIGAAV